MVRSPSFFRSNTARMERPIRRWISCVRPLCLPRAASRSLRVWVARGSMPYSAVTQPSPLPFLCGGTFSSTEAVHSTRGVAELDQHRAFGVDGVAAGDAHRAQLVGGAARRFVTNSLMVLQSEIRRHCVRAAERRMASLISAIERSMAASSRSSTIGVEHAGLDGGGEHAVVDAVGGDAAAWTRRRRGFPTPCAITVTLSLLVAAVAQRRLDQVGHRVATPAWWPRSRTISTSVRLPHRPSEHSRMLVALLQR